MSLEYITNNDFKIDDIKTLTLDVDQYKTFINKNKCDSNLNIFHMNIRSIRKNFDTLMILLAELKNKYDIIILTETWQINNKTDFSINNYNIEYSEGKYNQNDGVVIYIKNKYNYQMEIIKYGEVSGILVTIEMNKNNLTILGTYRSPNSNNSDYIVDLDELLLKYKTIDVMVGDINIDILDVNQISNNYLNVLYKNGYKSTINDYTRVTPTSKTCIDHIFVQDPKFCNDNISPIVLQTNITDHYATIIEIKSKIYKKKMCY